MEITTTLISTARKLVAISRVVDGPELTLYHGERKSSLHRLLFAAGFMNLHSVSKHIWFEEEDDELETQERNGLLRKSAIMQYLPQDTVSKARRNLIQEDRIAGRDKNHVFPLPPSQYKSVGLPLQQFSRLQKTVTVASIALKFVGM